MSNKDRRDESRLVFFRHNLQKMGKNHALHSAAAVSLKCCPKSGIASLQNFGNYIFLFSLPDTYQDDDALFDSIKKCFITDYYRKNVYRLTL